jgi:hypothetical protein
MDGSLNGDDFRLLKRWEREQAVYLGCETLFGDLLDVSAAGSPREAA